MKVMIGKQTEERAIAILNETLSEIPFLQIKSIERNVPVTSSGNSSVQIGDIDIVARLRLPHFEEQLLIVEVKGDGQPRYVIQAISQLMRNREKFPNAYCIFIAPYISPRSVEICKSEGIGYIDFSGNCYLSFKDVFIDRKNYPSLFQEKRELQSLFSPKATRVLRVLLDKPRKIWKVQELAIKAEVSLGLASNIKKRLLEQEFVQEENKGILLTHPENLLNKWAEHYTYENNKINLFYSIKSVPEIESELAKACEQTGINYALTSFSGAARLSPSIRYQQAMIYVEDRIEEIAKRLNLKLSARGANAWLWIPYDKGVFYGSKTIDGTRVASPEQIYLDLKNYHGRGAEAAEVILEEVIKPRW